MVKSPLIMYYLPLFRAYFVLLLLLVSQNGKTDEAFLSEEDRLVYLYLASCVQASLN